MSRPRFGASLLLVASSLLSAVGHGQERIPATEGRTLSGSAVQLPRDTQGKALVLIFGFGKSARQESTLWDKQLLAWSQGRDTFVFYQVAMLSGAPAFTRGLIVHAMKASIPETVRSHTLTLSSREDAWKALLHPQSESDAYVVLCDGAGTIQWQTVGASQEQINELHMRLNTLSERASEGAVRN